MVRLGYRAAEASGALGWDSLLTDQHYPDGNRPVWRIRSGGTGDRQWAAVPPGLEPEELCAVKISSNMKYKTAQ